jgi:LmbE family N-acetylglucosaminyl deacetylase
VSTPPPSRFDPADGTDESRWAAWRARESWPVLDLDDLSARPVVVLAAHPDDETLAVGGLLARLAERQADVRLVWATDGEASHPESRTRLAARLAVTRRAEADAAMAELGLDSAPRRRLGLPDGGLAGHLDTLLHQVKALLPSGATLLAPWWGDAHPDHDACGRAARALAATTGVAVLAYPVWTWTWAVPDDPRVPWERALCVPVPAAAARRKVRALACHASQVAPIGPAAQDAAVLSPAMLEHFARDWEVVLAESAA